MKVLIATPCYNAQLGVAHAKCVQELEKLLAESKIQCVTLRLQKESLIVRARNTYAAVCLHDRSFTHMLFIDNDISFQPADVVRMLNLDEPLLGGAYPIKDPRHTRDPADMRYAFSMTQPLSFDKDRRLLDVREMGTGFMLIRRDVLSAVAHTVDSYKTDDPALGQPFLAWHMFQTMVVDDRLLSEDYAFCHRARRLGFQPKIVMDLKLSHRGTFLWKGAFLAKIIRAPTSPTPATCPPTTDTK